MGKDIFLLTNGHYNHKNMSKNTVLTIREYKQFARKQRQSDNLALAGQYYIAAADGNLMRFRRQPTKLNFDEVEKEHDLEIKKPSPFQWQPALGRAMRNITAGALCFRLAEEPGRCESHCSRTKLFITDILEHEGESIESPQIGLYHEMIGDLELIGSLGGHEQSYERPCERYEVAEPDLGWSMEDDFDDMMHVVLILADSTGYEISEHKREAIYRTSLTERIQFKRDHYSEIIDRVMDAGNWDSDLL